MINKISLGLLAVIFVFGAKASAIEIGVTTSANVNAEVGQNKAETNSQATTQVNVQANVNTQANTGASATGTVKSQAKASTTGNATSTANSKGSQGDAQKSAVAIVVSNLLKIATRDGGIGAEVRLVAQEQASTSAKVKTDMDEANAESKVKVFFFGPNYKNLGELRSSIVTTANHIERLTKAKDRAVSASVKADLEAQIAALQSVSSSTEAFIESNKGKISAFGWLVKIFAD